MAYKGYPSSSASFSGFGNRPLTGPSEINHQNNIANGVNGGGYSQTPPIANMKIGNCMCCNSTLKFPLTVTCFRCTVCQTVNDLKPSIQRSEPVTPLTLDRIRSMVNTCNGNGKGTPNYDILEQAIQKTFSNWHILNESFSNGRPATLDDCGVELDEVREAYKIICDLPESVIRSMMKSTESVLKRPGRVLKREEDVKFLMIILENPLLGQRNNYPQELQHQHDIIKKIFGLLSNLSNELHHYLVNWFTQLSTDIFRKRIELVNSFITFLLNKQRNMSPGNSPDYDSDWRISSAARVMALFFAANKQLPKVQLSDFYNTLVDYIELLVDFNTWEQRSGKFAFCQYPFLISMGGKMRIMEYDAKRQKESEAHDAFIKILFYKRITAPTLTLKIRREFIIEDSLKQIEDSLKQIEEYSDSGMELKKPLKIEFDGEEGVDAGGLRKEWFLLLVRHLFDPQFGMFTWDEDSKLFWFNPASFENGEQYYLVGVVIGLAIYNSTILDVHLPLACYKKLLDKQVGLEDLKVFQPSFAKGLEQLLTFEGDVESTFCRNFVGEYDLYDDIQGIPLIPNGQNIAVTKCNRKEYVERYVNFVLNDSVKEQFEPFKRGFYQVCGGNALSLFQPEEIELLVRGSAEPLEIDELQAVTVYERFNGNEETIKNFWSIFRGMNPLMQRKLLTFVTGTDRVPATGLANVAFKISCIGEDSDRFPIAHTCFNQLCLYRYRSQEKLEEKLKRSILESEGFGLK